MAFLQQVSVRTRIYSGAERLRRRAAPPLDGAPQARRSDSAAARRRSASCRPSARCRTTRCSSAMRARTWPAVQKLKAGLDAAGVKTWFDLERLESGDDYDRKIQRNIARCSFFIPVVSATTQRRLEGYFRREWSYAIDRARNIADGARVHPARLHRRHRRAATRRCRTSSGPCISRGCPAAKSRRSSRSGMQDLLSARRSATQVARAPDARARPTDDRAPRRRRPAPVARPRVVHRGDARLLLRPRGGGRPSSAAACSASC